MFALSITHWTCTHCLQLNSIKQLRTIQTIQDYTLHLLPSSDLKARFMAVTLMNVKWPVTFLSEQIAGRNSADLQHSWGLSRRHPALTDA